MIDAVSGPAEAAEHHAWVGTDHSTVVPPAGADVTAQRPPSFSARNLMFARPLSRTLSGIPRPLSVTDSTISFPADTTTVTAVASACRDAFESASPRTASRSGATEAPISVRTGPLKRRVGRNLRV